MEQRTVVIGIDEVGRGAVFGPLCVGAVANPGGWFDKTVRDSKKVTSEKRRNRIAAHIRANTIWATAMVDNTVVNADMTGSLAACVDSLIQTMIERVVAFAPEAKIMVILDGDDRFPTILHHAGRDVPFYCQIRADANVFEVSAASIAAKVARDNWLHTLVREHPELKPYGIDSHKGYGSQFHALQIHHMGLTRWHRTHACESLMFTMRNKPGFLESTPPMPSVPQQRLWEECTHDQQIAPRDLPTIASCGAAVNHVVTAAPALSAAGG